MKVQIKLLQKDASPPVFAHVGDACADIRSIEDLIIPSGDIVMVPTGFAMAVPIGFEALVRPRSGLAAKYGISVVNSPGTIDSGYRGEVKVILANLGKSDFVIKKGDRIAQLAIRKVPEITFDTVNDLSTTDRGSGGFGSTGII